MTPYTHGHSSMAWVDKLPSEWRALINEYNSVNGIKQAIRLGLTVEQARARLEAQRIKRQWEPVVPQAGKPDMHNRGGRLKRITSSFSQWLAEHPPEKRKKRGLGIASLVVLVPLWKALAMVAR